MTTIERVTTEQLSTVLEALIVLLQDAVDSGASVGFLPPLSVDIARAYWQGTASDLVQGTRVLLVARHHTQVVGTVQLALATQPNAQHRAEVQKIMVHTQVRQQGIGQALMTAIEEAARRAGLTLLVLDTRRGDVSEQLYLKQGYICGGIIPHYARSATGVLDDTAIFYKVL
jgi:ribosomal protein S18 acetylase RimI-like enzyme